MGDEAKEVPAPKGLTEELRSRRAEAIQVAVRSFAVSRQSLSDGILSNSERLIRYYEGIAMSVERTPGIDAYEESAAAFRSVLRYSRHGTKTVSDKSGRTPPDALDDCDPILVRQAAYNLAVLHHRRIVQLRTEQQKRTWDAISYQKCKDEIEQLYEEAKRLYESVITELQELNSWGGLNQSAPTDLQAVDFATYIAARSGCILMLVDAFINAAVDERDNYLNESISGRDLREYCNETLSLLTSVYSKYQTARKESSPRHTDTEKESAGEARHAQWNLRDWFSPLRSRENQRTDAQVARRPLQRNSSPILAALVWQLEAASEKIRPDGNGTNRSAVLQE